jgi:hypothetical protein
MVCFWMTDAAVSFPYVPRDRLGGNLRAAEAARPAICSLRRHLNVLIPHRLFPGVEVARPAPQLEVPLSLLPGESFPGGLEIITRFLAALGRAVRLLAGITAGMETAAPYPLMGVDRHAGPATYVSDANVAEIDKPAMAVRIIERTARKRGHAEISVVGSSSLCSERRCIATTSQFQQFAC